MKYDFTTVVNRHNQSSEKWNMMKQRVPDIADDIVPFSVADMELKHAPEIIEGLIDYLQQDAILGYTTPYENYYKAVISWMDRRHNWKIQQEWISVSNGIIPALYDLVKAFAQPGEGVILMTPIYYPFYSAITANNRLIAECPMINTGEGYKIDFACLEKQAQDPNNKLLIFCSPHNPFARVWSREEIQRVADICIKNEVVIVADEIHHDLIMPGVVHTVMASLDERTADNVITCTSPSKTFNLAGMQAANIIIKNPGLRDRYRKEQARSGFDCLNALGFRTCELAYSKGEEWLEQLLELVKHNYETLKHFLAEHLPEVKVYPFEGTYLVWLDFRALGMDKEELETFMVEKAHVFMDEGYIFGEAASGFERMNIACPTSVMEAALTRIADAVHQRAGL